MCEPCTNFCLDKLRDERDRLDVQLNNVTGQVSRLLSDGDRNASDVMRLQADLVGTKEELARHKKDWQRLMVAIGPWSTTDLAIKAVEKMRRSAAGR